MLSEIPYLLESSDFGGRNPWAVKSVYQGMLSSLNMTGSALWLHPVGILRIGQLSEGLFGRVIPTSIWANWAASAGFKEFSKGK